MSIKAQTNGNQKPKCRKGSKLCNKVSFRNFAQNSVKNIKALKKKVWQNLEKLKRLF